MLIHKPKIAIKPKAHCIPKKSEREPISKGPVKKPMYPIAVTEVMA